MLLVELRGQALGILPIGFGLLDGGGRGGGLFLAQAGEFLACVLLSLLLLSLGLGEGLLGVDLVLRLFVGGYGGLRV